MKHVILVFVVFCFSTGTANAKSKSVKESGEALEHLQNRAQKAQAQHESDKKDLAAAQTEVQSLEDKVSKSEIAVVKLEVQVDADHKQLSETQDRLKDLQKRLEKAEKSRTKDESEKADLEEKIQKLQAEAVETETKLKSAQATADTKKLAADQERNRFREEKLKLKQDLSELEQKVEQSERAAKYSTQELSDDKTEMKNALDRQSELTKRLEKATSTKEKLDQAISKLKDDYTRMNADTQALESKVKDAEASTDSHRLDLETEKERLIQAKAVQKKERDELDQILKAKQSDLHALEQTIKSNKQDMEALKRDKENLTSKLQDATKQQASLELSLTKMREVTQKSLDDNRSLQARLNNTLTLAEAHKAEIQRTQQNYDQELTTLKTQIDELQSTVAKKQNEVREADGLATAGREELSREKEHRLELMKQINAADTTKARLDAEIRDLKRQYLQMTAENKKLENRIQALTEERKYKLAQEADLRKTTKSINRLPAAKSRANGTQIQ